MDTETKVIEIYKKILKGEMKRFPKDFWVGANGKVYSAIVTRYLIEDILKWQAEDVKAKASTKVFHQNKLKGMLISLYDDSAFGAIDNAYPGKFNEWELACTPRNYWNLETAKEATIWLYKEKLQMSDDEILSNAKRSIFVENGLDTMMHILFSNNAHKAIENAFPELKK